MVLEMALPEKVIYDMQFYIRKSHSFDVILTSLYTYQQLHQETYSHYPSTLIFFYYTLGIPSDPVLVKCLFNSDTTLSISLFKVTYKWNITM